MNSGYSTFSKAILMLITLNIGILFINGLFIGDIIQTVKDEQGIERNTSIFGDIYFNEGLFGLKNWANNNRTEKSGFNSVSANLIFGSIEGIINSVIFISLMWKITFSLLFTSNILTKTANSVGFYILSIITFIVFFINLFVIRELYRIFTGK